MIRRVVTKDITCHAEDEMPEQDNKRKDFNKIKKRKKIRKIIYFAFLVFLFLYVPIVLLASNGASAELAVLGKGSISDFIKAEGLVIKDEQVFSVPFDGVYTREASEGERVPAGYRIASVVEEAYSEKFREMEALGNEILARKKNGDINSGIFTRDLRQVEENIQNSIQEIASMVSTGNLGGISEIRNEIEKFSAYRDEIISGSSSPDAYTEDLTRQYNVLKQSLADKMSIIYTGEPGYISYEPDGFEGKYTMSGITGFSPEEILDLIKQDNSENIPGADEGIFAKLVTGNYYTLAFVLDNKHADKLKSRGRATIYIEDMGIEFEVNSIEFGIESDGKVCVFIKTNKKLGELASVRKINARIVFYEYSGLIVSVKSLLNMKAYPIRQVELAKVEDNWIHFITVDVVVENGSHAIIKNPDGELNLYDYYAVRPRKVEEGQVVK